MVSEKIIEEKLRDRVKAIGGRAMKFVSPGNSGVPDRIVVLPGGHIHFIELKRPGGKTTPLQDLQILKLKKLGCSVRIISGTDEIDDFIECCERQMREDYGI